MLTAKQQQVVDCVKYDKPKIIVCSGAKRSGKTTILIPTFMEHVSHYKGQKFIIGGVDQGSIRRNVLDEMELLLGHEIKLDKNYGFKLFSNMVYCFGGSKSDSWKSVRGFTSAGALLNEGTGLHDTFIKEVNARCSYPGAMVCMDTNTEGPRHPIKVDYIDKAGQRLSNGRLNIAAFNFSLYDNTNLDPEYVESIVASTPTGMFTDRDLLGLWVNPEGVVYRDFNEDNIITAAEADELNFVRYYAGVDWGYKHYGAIVVIGETEDGTNVLLFEDAKQFKEIDYWVDVAKQVKSLYGNIYFYCDSARPEYVTKFRNEGLNAIDADKSVKSGIEEVAKRMKTNKFLVVAERCPRFMDEVGNYVWDSRSGDPVKVDDDVMDAVRYATYSRVSKVKKAKVPDRRHVFG